MNIRLRRSSLLLTSAFIGMSMFGLGAVHAAGATDATYRFDIPAESLSQALADFSQTSPQQIIFSENLVKGRKTGGVHGEYTAVQALDVLLAGTDLRFEANSAGVLMVRPKNAVAAHAEGAADNNIQLADGAALETVVVTGTRKSIEDSIKTKRNLDVVSDTVSAEDVGQFPDGNLAEALQRITGVQITRQSPDGVTANEGQHVSVRGLPDDFNYVGLNGESVASASNNLITYTSARNFNFSVLAPDFISSLEVYKSPRADLTEGGVSATINVKTVLPFDIDKQMFKASFEGQSNTRATAVLPKLSVIYSDIFADGQVGLTVGLAWNKRKYDSSSTTDFQFDPQTVAGKNYLVLDSNFIINTQDAFDTKTAYGALQYRPTSDLIFSLIALHTETVDDAQFSSFGVRPFYSPTYSSLVADANNVLTTQVGDNSYFQAATYTHADATTLDNVTLKSDWSAGNLVINGALDYSKSVSTTNYFIISAAESGAFGLGPAYSGGYQINSGDPIASFVLDPKLKTSDPNNFFIGIAGGEILRREDGVHSAKVDATYDLPGSIIDAIKVGARYADELSSNADVFKYDVTQANKSVAPYVTVSPISAPSLSGYNGSANVPLQYPYFNTQSYLSALYGGSYNTWLNSPTTQQISNPTNNYTVGEKDTSLYAMARYAFDWHVPVHGNFGVRFVHTQQDVTDTAVDLNAITLIKPTPPPPAPSVIVPAGSRYTLSRSYDEVLPSFNLVADLDSDLLLRLAAAKVMSRPTLDSLVPRYTVSAGATNTVTGGNPDLNPFRAWQGDLSLEYYFEPGSLLSVALFYKSVESFIQTEHRSLVLQGVPFDQTLPTNTAGGYVEGVEVGYTQQFKSLPSFWSGFGVQANATWAQGLADADPAAGLKAHAFQNLSRWTANASVFYSAYGADVRLAYNYRSGYLFDANVRGGGNTSAYGGAYSTLDFQASYAITSSLTAFIEANNLTRAPQVFSMRVANGGAPTNYPQTWIEGERRLAAGIRLSY